ncbi:MAG TPA: histidine kinase dimerization/phospho-acceptor domain-containing protein, partial [Cyclobacteriaceae bacterium]|nr:histidine kinase dimerization/phospho-acceptor domain-containing protein [Cyclobacteriaceae bacterium]
MKTRTRITLTYAILTGITVVLLSTTVFYLVKTNKQQYFISRLKDRASIVAQGVFENDELIRNLKNEYLDPLPDEKDYVIKANPAAGTFEYDISIKIPSQFYRNVMQFTSDWMVDDDYVFHYGQLMSEQDQHYIIVVTAKDELGKERLMFLRTVLIFGSIGSMFMAVILGGIFAHRVIKPVSDITREVNRISASNLHKRLPMSTAVDEIELLKSTFNDMLDRLETSFEIQSNFINNASHELKTPIATIMAEIDILLTKPREPQEYKEALENIYSQTQKLGSLTESLLKLTQTGYDGEKQVLDIVRIDEILLEIMGDLNKRYPDNKVNLRLADMPEDDLLLTIPCNKPLLSLALMNIITNAVKYSDNQEVFVTLTADEEIIKIVITDIGIG